MSGVIGYCLKTNKAQEEYRKALRYWNEGYGSDWYEEQVDEGMWIGSKLDHMSMKVPKQKQFLRCHNVCGVIDALIYNRAEISNKYCIDDIYSDEEMLFHLLMKSEIDVLSDVNGDFAGVLYDSEEKKVTFFRDHMGIRPLYYYIDDEQFIFSTDLRGILAIPGLKIDVHEIHLFRLLMGSGGCCGLETDYEQIQYTQKGSYYIVDVSKDKICMDSPQQYWRLGTRKIRLKNEAAYIAEMRRLVEEAVRIRMDAVDGPIGCELSGGLDSSVLSTLILRLGREGRYVSWSSDPALIPLREGKDERRVIEDICRRENIECKYIGNDKDIVSLEQRLNQLNPPDINTVQITRGCRWFEKQGVRCVLTGHGGDQGVSHRCNFYEMWYHHEYYSFVRAVSRQMAGRKHRLYETLKEVKRRLTVVHPNFHKYQWSADNMGDLLNPEYKEKMLMQYEQWPSTFAYDVLEYFNRSGTRERMDTTAYQSAPFGIRYLFPYLDYKVIDYAVSIPRWLYNNGRGNRWIYQQAFADLIPESLRKMHDKKTASTSKTFSLTQEDVDENNKLKDELVEALDRDFWSKYLDFDALDSYYLTMESTELEYICFEYQNSYLLSCLILHYTMLHAGDPIFKGTDNE